MITTLLHLKFFRINKIILFSVTELGREIFLPGRFQVFVKDVSFCNFDGWWEIQWNLLIYILQSSGFKLIFWLHGKVLRWSNTHGGSKAFYLKQLFKNVYQVKISIFVYILQDRATASKNMKNDTLSPKTYLSSGHLSYCKRLFWLSTCSIRKVCQGSKQREPSKYCLHSPQQDYPFVNLLSKEGVCNYLKYLWTTNLCGKMCNPILYHQE